MNEHNSHDVWYLTDAEPNLWKNILLGIFLDHIFYFYFYFSNIFHRSFAIPRRFYLSRTGTNQSKEKEEKNVAVRELDGNCTNVVHHLILCHGKFSFFFLCVNFFLPNVTQSWFLRTGMYLDSFLHIFFLQASCVFLRTRYWSKQMYH